MKRFNGRFFRHVLCKLNAFGHRSSQHRGSQQSEWRLKRLKAGQNLKIFLLFVLLFNAAAVPVFFTEIHNRYYMDKTVIFPVYADNLEDSAGNYDLWERLKILKNAVLIQTQNRKSYQVIYYSNETEAAERVAAVPDNVDGEIKEQLVRRAEKQLRKLKKYQTLPEIPFSDRQEFSCFKQTYMDLENPSYALSVWELYIEYPYMRAHLYMDMETSALCEVELSSIDRGFIYQKGEVSAEGFMEYLNSFSKAPEGNAEEDETFYGEGVFSQQYICLYAASSDKNNNSTVVYHFDPSF